MRHPLDWILWTILIFNKGQIGYSGHAQHQHQQDGKHHRWSAIFSPNIMMFDDIKSPSPNVKELSNSPMKRPPEAHSEHFVLKFQDLPPWRTQKASKSDSSNGGSNSKESKNQRVEMRDSVILDLRPYNPLTSHLLSQSYIYPASNGLTQTDRDYFAMVQSETGLSEVHFEAPSTNSHQKEAKEEVIRSENKIKELDQLATVSTTLEVNSQKCQHRDCKEDLQASSKEGLFSAEETTLPTSSFQNSPTTSTKAIPRFAYHRVPGSFASFRVIKPAYPDATMPSFDSFHDDEPPQLNENSLQRPQRDVAAVHLVQ